MPSQGNINLFKPGTSVDALILYGTMLDKHFSGTKYERGLAGIEPSVRRSMSEADKIMDQYSNLKDLSQDMVPNMIEGYSGMFPRENRFLQACQRLNKMVTENVPPDGYVYDYRAFRLSLYESRKYPGKLMLGAYTLFHKSRNSDLPPAPGKYLSQYGADDYAMPMFAICMTMTNLIDLLDGLGYAYIDTDICVKAIQNWNDNVRGWLSKQRVSEDQAPSSDPDSYVGDWNFLANSKAAKLCRMNVLQGVTPRCKGPDGRDKTLSGHFTAHRAYAEARKYVAKNGDFGKPIMQTVKIGEGRYSGHDRFCVLTDQAIQVEWYTSNLNAVKSISFCDPVQIVEWYAGSPGMAAFQSKVQDRSKIPMRMLKLAYQHQADGLGWELDHAMVSERMKFAADAIRYWNYRLRELDERAK